MTRLTLAAFALVMGTSLMACHSDNDRDRRADRGAYDSRYDDRGNTNYQDNYFGGESRDRWDTYGTNRDYNDSNRSYNDSNRYDPNRRNDTSGINRGSTNPGGVDNTRRSGTGGAGNPVPTNP